MLGTEPEVIETYVETGDARIVFWPVLNHGDPSVFATLTAECVAQQDINLFWDVHKVLFTNQRDLWTAGRDYYVNTAVSVGADQETFERCYDSMEAMDQILELDALRRARGVYSQPVFDVNGQIFHGSQSFNTFSEVIEAALP